MGKDMSSDMLQDSFGRFVGASGAMQKVYDKIKRVARSDIPVFITGKTGTGKEVCAQSVHTYSDRHNKPFIALNCAALPANMIDSALFGHVRGAFTNAEKARDGAIARAEGGTLFLDEICDMPLESQAKLLRFTQRLEYQKLGSDTLLKSNVRIICATNCDPLDRVQQKVFREDLYYRLHAVPIMMPDLKERDEDMIDIAYYYLEQFSKKYKKPFEDFSDITLSLLKDHEWPGNVRELENLIHQVVSSYDASLVTAEMLPPHIGKLETKGEYNITKNFSHDVSLPLWRVEKRAIENVLRQTSGNVQKAAQILDVAPSTIYRKMQSWKK